jgi:hypothetical protein
MQRVFSVWKNKSKNGTTYYTGKLGDLSLIGFNNQKENEKQPDVTFYVREEQKKKDNTTITTEELGNDPFEEFGESVSIEDNFLE